MLLKDSNNLGFCKSCLFHDEQLSLKLTLLSNFKLSAIQGYLHVQGPPENKKTEFKNNAPPATKISKLPLDDIELTDEENELMEGCSDEHKRFLKLIAEIVIANVLENNGRSSSLQVKRDAKAKNSRKNKKGDEQS